MKLKTVLFFQCFLISTQLLAGGGFADQASIYELLVKPEQFVGKTVYIKGFLGDDEARIGVFPSKQDAYIENIAARIFFDKSNSREEVLKNCQWTYAAISGKFNYNPETKIKSLSEIYSVRMYLENESMSDTVESKPCFFANSHQSH